MAKAKEKHQCCGQIWQNYHYSSCSRNGKVERDGKWYCGTHDPVAVEEKSKKRDAIFEAKWAAENKACRDKEESRIRLQLATRALLQACHRLQEWDEEKPDSQSLSILLNDLRMSVCEFEQASK